MIKYLAEFSPPIECEVMIYQGIGTPSACLAGIGSLSFDWADHLRSTKAGGASMSREGTSAALAPLRTSNDAWNDVDPSASSVATTVSGLWDDGTSGRKYDRVDISNLPREWYITSSTLVVGLTPGLRVDLLLIPIFGTFLGTSRNGGRAGGTIHECRVLPSIRYQSCPSIRSFCLWWVVFPSTFFIKSCCTTVSQFRGTTTKTPKVAISSCVSYVPSYIASLFCSVF